MGRIQTPKENRLQARVTTLQHQQLERAAGIRGQSLTDFVVNAAQEAAERVIREHELIVLTEEDRKVFFDTLRRPSKPNSRLKAAAKRRRETLGE